MWEKIKEFVSKLFEVKMTTPRACLTAFMKAIEQCDVNEDGYINPKELLKLYKDTTIKSVFTDEMTTTEMHDYVESFSKRF